MTEIDQLVIEKFVKLREEIVRVFKEKHPYVVGMMEAAFANKENSVGLQVLQDGEVAGTYTVKVRGIHVSDTTVGVLEPYVRHPLLGIVIKPVIAIEKQALEKLVADQSYADDLLGYIARMLPNITLKFLP